MTSKNRKYAAFDLETGADIPEDDDWQDHRPLGITCAALYAPELGEPITWHGTDETGEIADRMNSGELTLMVRQLEHLQQQRGFTIVTWNGLGFDFDVLAEESGQMEECRQLALRHLDLMFHFFCKQGYPLGLSAAAAGMGVEGKTEGMDGKLAVQMWEEGERESVIDYCAQDTRCTLEVAHARVRGRHQAIYALSDDHLEDDWGKTGHTRLTLPPNPIGWALSRAADRFGITCRQWTMQDGTRVWNEMKRETRQAEIALSMPPGTVEDAVQAMEGISMEDLTDIREIMEEMGLDNWEDPAEDPAGVEIERRQINNAMSRFNTREATMKFIAITAELPEYQRDQVWAEMLHHARAGDWEKIPEPIREWSRQVIKYIDQSGPRPDYWPDQIPW